MPRQEIVKGALEGVRSHFGRSYQGLSRMSDRAVSKTHKRAGLYIEQTALLFRAPLYFRTDAYRPAVNR